MEWLEQLRGQGVGLDTAPLIYFIEQNDTYLDRVRPFFEAINREKFQVVTSTLTLIEVLIHPLRANNKPLADEYRDIILAQGNLTTLPMTVEIAETAAQLRATHNLRTPDAIQVATTIQGGATYLLTNDTRLAVVPELIILVLEDLLPESA